MPNINPRSHLEAKEDTLGSMFLGNRRQYRIPYNQRPWSWDSAHLHDLLSDFRLTLAAYFDDKSTHPRWRERAVPERDPHFIGTFIFVVRDPENWEVFDGQQRLTAISMLVAALRDGCTRLRSAQDPGIRDKADMLFQNLTRWLTADPMPNERRPRILADQEFADLFDALVVEPRDDAERKSMVDALNINFALKPRHNRLKRSFEEVKRWVDGQIATQSESDAYEFLAASTVAVSTLFICIWAKVNDEAYGYKVFRSLNARGKALQPADNIKNELFEVAPKQLHSLIRSNWQKLSELTDQQDIGEFLRRRYLGRKGACKKSQLYKRIRDDEIINADIRILTSEWVTDAQLLKDVMTSNVVPPNAARNLKALFEVLQASLAAIMLLPAARRFLAKSPKDFYECTQLALAFAFRYLTIGGHDTPGLEEMYALAGRHISEGKSVAEVRDLLQKERRCSDTDFLQGFAGHVERRVKVQFYILEEIERFLAKGGGMGPLPHSPDQHVEHILPRRLSRTKSRLSEWAWARNSTEHGSLVNRLGNLLILEADINKDVSNFEFDAKRGLGYPQHFSQVKANGGKRARKSYKDSQLTLPKELVAMISGSVWDKSAINKRQSELSQVAAKVWRL